MRNEKSRVYIKPEKAATNFFTGHAECRECNVSGTLPVKYVFVMNRQPDTTETFVLLRVTKIASTSIEKDQQKLFVVQFERN